MIINKPYAPRSIRFIKIIRSNNWQVKLYGISEKNVFPSDHLIALAVQQLPNWFASAKNTHLRRHDIATLIIHEYDFGCFAVLNWWVEDNMLQNEVYHKLHQEPEFYLFKDNAVATCVWEMAVWWHERNAWVTHILMKSSQPDVEAYLNDQLHTIL